MHAGVLARTSGDLPSEQAKQNPIFVSGPNGPVLPQERGSGALLSAETKTANQQARSKPLETDGHFGKAPARTSNDPVNNAATDKSLADGRGFGPGGSILQEVLDRYRQKVIWIQQTSRAGNDSVPVGIGVISKGDRVPVLKFQ